MNIMIGVGFVVQDGDYRLVCESDQVFDPRDRQVLKDAVQDFVSISMAHFHF